MSERVLTNPTVGEMIEALSGYDPKRKFRINDADTSWTINIIHVQAYEDYDTVTLYGCFDEMERA